MIVADAKFAERQSQAVTDLASQQSAVDERTVLLSEVLSVLSDQTGDLYDLVDDDVVPLLERIVKNTSSGVTAVPQPAQTRLKTVEPNRSDVPRQAATPSTPATDTRRVGQSRQTATGSPERKPAASPAATQQAGFPGSGAITSISGMEQPEYSARQGEAKPTPEAQRKTPPAPATDTRRERTARAESGSQQAAAETRRKREAKEERETIKDSFRAAVAGWNGSFLSDASKDSDMTDAAGTAAGGAFWASAKELSEVASKIGESAQEDDGSLAGMLKKAVKDKTGITSVQQKAASLRATATERIKQRIGGGSVPAQRNTMPAGYRRDKNGRVRNERGHFVSGPQRTMLDNPAEKQTEALDEVAELLKQSKKDEDKRHEELVSTVAAAGGDAGGLLDSLGGFMGRGGGLRLPGKMGGKIGGMMGKAAGKLGRFGKVGSLISGGAASMLPSIFTGGTAAASSAAGGVAGTAAKTAGGVSKWAGMGGKALAGGSKALRTLGPAAAILTAGFDAVGGWNDEGMQQEAFGLKDGQEATTGQKAATSMANVLDMGGLVSGGLSMLGMDASTSGLARGIHDTVSGIGSFFGFGGDDGKVKDAAISPARSEKIESVRDMEKSTVTEQAAGSAQAKAQTGLEKEVKRLVDTLAGDKQKQSRNIERADTPPISTEFDDATLTLMAYDRV
jgi:hypothetical protein